MIEYVLSSKTKVRILQLLVNRSKWIFSGIEITKELSIPKATVHRALKELRDQNILRELKKGKRFIIYQLNKDNCIVQELLKPLFLKEYKLPIEKAKEFCKNLKIKVGIIFGSASRGQMTPASDIDIVLILDNPKKIEKKVDKLKQKFLDKEGIIFSIHYFKTNDFRRRYRKKDPHIIDISNGKVIFGDLERIL